jgi:hypothetical protein
MPFSTRRSVATVLAVTILVPAALVSGSDTGPDFGGTWHFVPQRSDSVREKVLASVGPDATSGDIRKDAPRLWIRTWLLGLLDKPDAGVLTIEVSPEEFRTGTGEDLRVYYFGRESTRQGEGGPLRKATVRREGGLVVVEERAEKGGGRIREVYSLGPGGRSLLLEWHLEHKALRQPLDLRLAFDKQAP